jgi:Flp pilus assembly protein TadD
VEARTAREDARRALDRGAVAAAITAATSSVELDPTDGDAWLILGAAYQVAGKSAEARNAFASCCKLAKRGDVSECRAFAF